MTSRPGRSRSVARPLAFASILVLAGACGGGGGGSGPGGGSVPPPPDTLLDTATTDAADAVAYAGTAEGEFTIMAALTRAGFDVMNADGTTLLEGDAPRQGIAFELGDLAILSRAMAAGPRLTVDDLVASWAAFLPVSSDAALADQHARLRARLVDDLRRAAASSQATRQYWGQLVVALGRQADAPFDLLDHAVPGSATLDPLQVALLTYRFQADLWLAGQRAGGARKAAPPTALRTAAAAGPRPCTMTDTEQTVMDATALSVSTFMGGVVDEIAEHVPAAEKLSKLTAGANAALTVVKMIWTFIVLDGKVEPDAPLLVRTRGATAGEPRTFTASFRYDTGDAQVLNCLRPALNAAGIDFSLPQDGPLAGARVDWELFGTRARVAGRLPIVRFQQGQVQLGGRTDDEGRRQVIIEGQPQSPAVAANAIPDYRATRMMAKVALKESKLWTDLQDAVGAALAGNPASIFLSAIVETLSRMNTPIFSANIGFTVQDWTDPGGALVHVTIGEARSGTVTSDGNGTETVALVVDSWRKMKGEPRPIDIVLPGAQPGLGATTLTENYRRALDYRGNHDRVEPCICSEGTSATVQWRELHAGGAGEADLLLMIEVQPSGAFELTVPLGGMAGTAHGFFQTSGCGLPPSETTTHDHVQAFLPDVVVTGQLDLSQPSGTIEGTATVATELTIPSMLGGLYSAGSSQLPVFPAVTVEYAFSYTVVRIPFGKPAAPPAIAARPSRPRLVVPALTSVQAVPLTAAKLACGPSDGP